VKLFRGVMQPTSGIILANIRVPEGGSATSGPGGRAHVGEKRTALRRYGAATDRLHAELRRPIPG
jgi:hypothetical protein